MYRAIDGGGASVAFRTQRGLSPFARLRPVQQWLNKRMHRPAMGLKYLGRAAACGDAVRRRVAAVHGALQIRFASFTHHRGLLRSDSSAISGVAHMVYVTRTVATHALSILATIPMPMAVRQTGCAIHAPPAAFRKHTGIFALIAHHGRLLKSRVPFVIF